MFGLSRPNISNPPTIFYYMNYTKKKLEYCINNNILCVNKTILLYVLLILA